MHLHNLCHKHMVIYSFVNLLLYVDSVYVGLLTIVSVHSDTPQQRKQLQRTAEAEY